MAIMPDIEAEAKAAVGWVDHEAAQLGHGITGLFHHKQPAFTPATMTAAAVATQEEPMSILTEAEDLYASAKNELGKFEQALPGALAKAKQFEASPFALLVEKAAGSVLPPEAVAIAVSTADKVLDELISLYQPQQAAPAAPDGQPPAPAQ